MTRDQIAKIVVQSFYAIYDDLGHGFLEKIYENALALELCERGLRVEQQKPIDVFYKGQKVGAYFADLLVEGCVVVELKATEHLALEHEAQLLHYLKASEIELGLLVNFGPQPQVKRKIYETARRSV